MLKVNNCLRIFDLSGNQCGHQVFSCIFEGLEHNTALLCLDVHMISLTSLGEGITHIAQALKSNHSLQILNIYGLRLNRNDTNLIFESLMFNSTLQRLHISNIDSKIQSTFKRKRAANKLLPVDIVLKQQSDNHIVF